MEFGQFFILGNPRSGTSLLRLLLNSHSALCVPPECGFLLWLHPKYKDWNLESLESDTLNEFVEDLIVSKKFETWNLEKKELLETIRAFAPKNYEQLAHCVYLTYAQKAGKRPRYFGDKNNYYIHHLDQLDELYKKKIVVHLIRDGRDVAASYRGVKKLSSELKYIPNLTSNIKEIAAEWSDNNFNIQEHFQSYENYIVVKYEDLLLNAASVLQEILDKFNLKFEEQMLSYYIENKQNNTEPAATMDWKRKTLEPIDKLNIGKYESELTIDEIDSFNLVAAKALKKFNYKV